MPAIPLTFQKHKHQEPARTKPTVHAAPLVSSPAVVEIPSSPTPPPTEIAPPVVSTPSEEPEQVQVPEKSEEATIQSSPLLTPPTPLTPAQEVQEKLHEVAVGDTTVESTPENEIRGQYTVSQSLLIEYGR